MSSIRRRLCARRYRGSLALGGGDSVIGRLPPLVRCQGAGGRGCPDGSWIGASAPPGVPCVPREGGDGARGPPHENRRRVVSKLHANPLVNGERTKELHLRAHA